MKILKSKEPLIIDVAKKTAILSFVFGTIQLLAYLVTRSNNLIYLGVVYVYIAFFVNLLILIILLIMAITNSENRNRKWLAILYLLLNLPIAFGYFVIVTTIA